jgi:hypothetical protein
VLFPSRQIQRRSAQGSNPSGEWLLERVRGTAVVMLATAALFGLAVVAMISQQEFTLLPPLPIEGTQAAQVAGSGEPAVASAAALPQPVPAPTPVAGSSVALTPTAAQPGSVPASEAGDADLGNRRPLGSSLVTSPESEADSPPGDSSPQPPETPGPTESQPGPASAPVTGAPGKSGLGGPPSTAGSGEVGEGAPETPPAEEEPAPESEPLPEVEPEPEPEPVPPAEPTAVETGPEAPGALPASTVSVPAAVVVATG